MGIKDIAGSVVIVDNDPLALRLLMAGLARSLPNVDIAWTEHSAEDALFRLRANGAQPDALLVDVSLEGMNGLELCREIRRRSERPMLLAMTAFSLAHYAGEASGCGAQGIVSKHELGAITRAVAALLAHGTVTTGPKTGRILQEDSDCLGFDSAHDAYLRLQSVKPRGIDTLNETEERIIELCANGYTADRIARELGRSISTINTHMERAMRKTGAANRTHLVALWLRERGRHGAQWW